MIIMSCGLWYHRYSYENYENIKYQVSPDSWETWGMNELLVEWIACLADAVHTAASPGNLSAKFSWRSDGKSSTANKHTSFYLFYTWYSVDSHDLNTYLLVNICLWAFPVLCSATTLAQLALWPAMASENLATSKPGVGTLSVNAAACYRSDATMVDIFGPNVQPGRELLDLIVKTYKVSVLDVWGSKFIAESGWTMLLCCYVVKAFSWVGR